MNLGMRLIGWSGDFYGLEGVREVIRANKVCCCRYAIFQLKIVKMNLLR